MLGGVCKKCQKVRIRLYDGICFRCRFDINTERAIKEQRLKLLKELDQPKIDEEIAFQATTSSSTETASAGEVEVKEEPKKGKTKKSGSRRRITKKKKVE